MCRGNSRLLEKKIVSVLIDNPHLSLSELANNLGKFKTSAYRIKKKLEENKTILGYTPVVNEIKLGRSVFIVLIRGKIDVNSTVNEILNSSEEKIANGMGVRLIDVFYTTGQYDFVIVFSAENEINGKSYIDSIKDRYADFIENVVALNSFFILRKEGKLNSDSGVLEELSSIVERRPLELGTIAVPAAVKGICTCCTFLMCTGECAMHLL